jgi:hypothetical protein
MGKITGFLVLDRHERDCGKLTIACTRVAPEGGFDMSARPNLRAWLTRCEKALSLSRTGSGS